VSTPIYEGKAKQIFRAADGQLAQHFKDSATAFNGQKIARFPGKGALNSKMSAYFFDQLTRAEIPHHFVRWEEPNILITKSLRMIPVEVVVRNRVAGSLARRSQQEEGTPLQPALVEWYLKDDAKGDPQVSEEELHALHHIPEKDLREMQHLALMVNRVLLKLLSEKDLDLVDFKLEFGKDADGTVILGDEISPDTCRIWDHKTKEKLDKDRFRYDLGDLLEGYQKIWSRLQGETKG
jgi:phosphoribosylaminoimidazole-succinocarboxamide synthase